MLTFIGLAVGLILMIMVAGVAINILSGLVLALTLMVRFPAVGLTVAAVIGYDIYARAHGMETVSVVVASMIKGMQQ